MLQSEHPRLPKNSTDLVQMWRKDTRKDNYYTNIATNYSTTGNELLGSANGLASGGILSDDMVSFHFM